MADDFPPPNLDGLVAALLEGAFDPAKLKRLEKVMGNAHAYGATTAMGAQVAAVGQTVEDPESLVTKAEDATRGAVAFVLAHLVAHLVGIEVPPSALRNAFNGGADSVVGKAIGQTMVAGIAGNTVELQPGDAGAVRMLGMITNLTLTSWFEGILIEYAESLGGIVHPIEKISDLGKELIEGLGLSRLARVALRPLVQTVIATPLEWQTNEKYRPALLGTSTVAHQVARGRWTLDQANEELARQGYSAGRIEALLSEQLKYLSADDLAFLVWQEILSQDEAVVTLGNQGYDAQTASKILGVQALRREDTIDRDIAGAAATAFADGRIGDGDFTALLDATIPSSRERDLLVGAGRAKRALRQVHLSPAEAKACVLAQIIPLSEYRDALERVGYVPDAIDALEMLLRLEIDQKTTAVQVKQQLAAEKAAAAQAKAITDAQKKADAEAAAALKRQGSPAELAHAVVRGLIPISRLEQVLRATLDADTVAIYVADVEQQRQAYLDQQRKADDAAKRAAAKGLTTSELSTALVDGVLTVEQVRAQLVGNGLDPADVAVLLASMQQRAADHAAAVRAHDQAAARAKNRPVDLSKAEALVRAGHWTFAQYNSLLASLGFSEAAVADLDVLLQDQIVKDQTAAALRAAAAQASPEKGLSLAQARSAVLAGTSTLEQFQTYLVNAGYTADATAILVAELRDAVVAADAARARRAATPSPSDGRAVALAEVTKAARLGVITPAAYQAELVARGYSPDDVALEMDLLLIELGATRATQNLLPPTDAAPATTGLTLAQIATAVKAGLSTIDDYRTRAVQLGYSSDDVQTLTNVLTDEVNTLAFATARHTTIAGTLTLQGVDIGPIEAAVQAGKATLDDYEAWILQIGYGAADAALLRALLASKL